MRKCPRCGSLVADDPEAWCSRCGALAPPTSRVRPRWAVLAGAGALGLAIAAFLLLTKPQQGDDATAPQPAATAAVTPPEQTTPAQASPPPTRTPKPPTPTAPARKSPAARPTVTVTRTLPPVETPTPRATSAPPAPSVEIPARAPKPAAWPAYEYGGPGAFDVCLQPSFPMPGRLLRVGDGQVDGTDPDSESIRSAQAGLRSLNYGRPEAVEATGYFGPATRAALTSFQARKGLVADGTLGQESWSALHAWVNSYAGNCP